MNYIRHTRAAFGLLASQPDATPHHVSLYVALFSQWNEERFPAAVMLVRAEAMRAAHIGSPSTYLKCLRELSAYGLITYQPSRSEHRPSRCLMHELMPGQLAPEMAQALNSNPPPASPTSGASTSPKSGPSSGASRGQAVVSLDKQVETKVNENKPVLLIKLHAAAAEKKGGSALLTGRQHLGPDRSAPTAPKQPPNVAATPAGRVAPKRKGPAAPARSRRPEVPFAESDLAPVEAFVAAFQGTDYELANLRYYHELVANWRQHGEPPLRRDWLATAKKFMLNDMQDGKLKLATSATHPRGAANPLTPAEFGAAVDEYANGRYA